MGEQEDEFLDELRATALKLHNNGELNFNGFSEKTLSHYRHLMDQGLSLELYNNTKDIYFDFVKPDLFLFMEDLTKIISVHDNGFEKNAEKMIGHPCPHGNPKSFAWAAMTRVGNNRRNDLQFFVSIKADFLRVGLYTSKKNASQKFNSVVLHASQNVDGFIELVDEAAKEGYSLDTHRDDAHDDGSSIPLKLNRNLPHVSIGEHQHFHLVKPTSHDFVRNFTPLETIDKALHGFAHTRRMYEFCMSKNQLPKKYRIFPK